MSRSMRRIQLLVVGYSQEICTPKAYDIAYQVGKEVAAHDAVLLTGGLGGVMEAAAKGVKEAGGISVGVIPYEDFSHANPYSNVVIATGIGFARNYITAYSADAVIVVGGGVGTLIEMSIAYQKKKPIITLLGSGGIADEYAGKSLDERKLTTIIGEDSPRKAVQRALLEVGHIRSS